MDAVLRNNLARWELAPSSRITDPRWRFSWPVGIAFAILCVLISYPGRLNGDSLFSMFATTTPGLTNNWHSATLEWFWGLAGPLLGQPAGALAMQAVLFGIFAGFLPRVPGTLRGRATLAGELLLRFVLTGAMGYIGKDAIILLTLLIVVQLLRLLPHRRLGPIGIGALIAATILFLLAKAPDFFVIVVAAALLLPFFVRSKWRYAALVAATFVTGALAIPLNRTVDSAIFAARDWHPDKQLILFDLAGISVRTGQNAFAAVPGWPTATLPPLKTCYVPYMWDSFAEWAPCGGYAKAYDALEGPLKRRWIAEIATHPVAYLQHRLDYAGYLLGSRDHDSWGIDGAAINDATDPAAIAQLRSDTNDVHARGTIGLWRPSLATPPLRWLERTTLKFPKAQWVGLITCLAILLLGWMRRADGIRLGALLASGFGVGNFAMLLLFGVADPGRYMLPTVCLAYVALLALLAPDAPDASASPNS